VRELDYRCAVLHLPFWPYAKLFSEWIGRPACVYPGNGHWVDRVARLLDRLPDTRDINWELQQIALQVWRRLRWLGVDMLDKPEDERVNLEDPAFIERAQAGRYFLCAGWEYGCWAWLERHAAEVRGLFVPVQPYRGRAEDFAGELRRQYDVLVGLFARRGDYRTFFDGRFYYAWEDYARWIREVVELHPGKRVGVIIASDDWIPSGPFDGLPVVCATGSVNRGGHWLESFLELSLCDMIIGPPSTFAACAAFLGDKPFWPLRSSGQTLRTDQLLTGHLFEAARDPEITLAVR
jgi:hypothetical protein